MAKPRLCINRGHQTHFAGQGSSQSRLVPRMAGLRSSSEFMVMHPPFSSEEERKSKAWITSNSPGQQLNLISFEVRQMLNWPLSAMFSKPEGRVSCSWSSPSRVFQKSCEKWLVWTKGSFTIIWKPLEKADVKCHVLCCYLTGPKEERSLCQRQCLFFLLWRYTLRREGFSQRYICWVR